MGPPNKKMKTSAEAEVSKLKLNRDEVEKIINNYHPSDVTASIKHNLLPESEIYKWLTRFYDVAEKERLSRSLRILERKVIQMRIPDLQSMCPETNLKKTLQR